jgi:hypothetical protein
MAKKTATNSENNMDNQNNAIDPLAALGLGGDDAAASTSTQTAEPQTEAADVARAQRNTSEDFTIGTVSRRIIKELPKPQRGERAGRFDFASIAAPSKEGYDSLFVEFKGGDAAKFRRSVQAAATAANRGDEKKYFETRQEVENGKLVGMLVIRTDNRPAK